MKFMKLTKGSFHKCHMPDHSCKILYLLSGNVKPNLQDEWILRKHMEKNFISNTLENPIYFYENVTFARFLRYIKFQPVSFLDGKQQLFQKQKFCEKANKVRGSV